MIFVLSLFCILLSLFFGFSCLLCVCFMCVFCVGLCCYVFFYVFVYLLCFCCGCVCLLLFLCCMLLCCLRVVGVCCLCLLLLHLFADCCQLVQFTLRVYSLFDVVAFVIVLFLAYVVFFGSCFGLCLFWLVLSFCLFVVVC